MIETAVATALAPRMRWGVAVVIGKLLVGSLLSVLLHISAPQAASEEPACLRVCENEFSTAGQRECLKREKDVAQRQLDAAVASVESSFAKATDIDASTQERDIFREAQAAWNSYYTADCAAVSAHWKGSGARAAVLQCGVVRLRRRMYDLWSTYPALESSMPLPAMICSDQRSGP